MQPSETHLSDGAASSATCVGMHSIDPDPSAVQALPLLSGNEECSSKSILDGVSQWSGAHSDSAFASVAPTTFGVYQPAESLSLSSIGSGAQYLPRCLPRHLLMSIERSDSSVLELDFSCERLGESACRTLARALSLNTRITSLNLCDCAHADAVLLCEAIAHLTTMTHLSLSCCDLQPKGTAHLCATLQRLTAMTYLNLDGIHLQSSGASHLCSVLPHLTAITALILSGNELSADDGARICAAAAAAGLTKLVEMDLCGNGFDAFHVVDCDTWELLGLPSLDDDIVIEIDLNWAPFISWIMMFGQGDWQQRTLQYLVAWRESAVLPPLILCRTDPKVMPGTIDRWLGWSPSNIPATPCMLACYSHFALACLSNKHLTLPKPLKIHFPYKLVGASCGLFPRERLRLGSGSLVALLARRLCMPPPVQRHSAPQFIDKLGSRVIRRVYSWQPNSVLENAFLNALQDKKTLRSKYPCFRACADGEEFSLDEHLETMTAAQRARLLSSDTCFKVLTQRNIDPVNGSWFRAEYYPREVVSDLADGIMLNLYRNMDEGELYFMHEDYYDHWRNCVETMSEICPVAVTRFIRTQFMFDFCKVIICELMEMFDRDEFELSEESNFYDHDRCTFPQLCSMLSDIAAVDISLLQPCAPLLLEILDPHWTFLSESEWCGMFGSGSNVSSDSVSALDIRSYLVSCASCCSSTQFSPFPIMNYSKQMKFMRDVSMFISHHSSIDNEQNQENPCESPLFVYMLRMASILSNQLSLNCVELRVHGLIGQPCQTLTCSPNDPVESTLRSVCSKFGVDPAHWRLHKDRNKLQELPIEKTLDSCSVSCYCTLYLG